MLPLAWKAATIVETVCLKMSLISDDRTVTIEEEGMEWKYFPMFFNIFSYNCCILAVYLPLMNSWENLFILLMACFYTCVLYFSFNILFQAF